MRTHATYLNISFAFLEGTDGEGARGALRRLLASELDPGDACEALTTLLAATARAAGMSPRALCDQLFKESPSDDEWVGVVLPSLEELA